MGVVGIIESTLSGEVGEDVLLIAGVAWRAALLLFSLDRRVTEKREILRKSEGAGLSEGARLQPPRGDTRGPSWPPKGVTHPRAL